MKSSRRPIPEILADLSDEIWRRIEAGEFCMVELIRSPRSYSPTTRTERALWRELTSYPDPKTLYAHLESLIDSGNEAAEFFHRILAQRHHSSRNPQSELPYTVKLLNRYGSAPGLALNKAQAIREALAANPGKSSKAIATMLTAQGLW
jgi:hypothetical protein